MLNSPSPRERHVAYRHHARNGYGPYQLVAHEVAFEGQDVGAALQVQVIVQAKAAVEFDDAGALQAEDAGVVLQGGVGGHLVELLAEGQCEVNWQPDRR